MAGILHSIIHLTPSPARKLSSPLHHKSPRFFPSPPFLNNSRTSTHFRHKLSIIKASNSPNQVNDNGDEAAGEGVVLRSSKGTVWEKPLLDFASDNFLPVVLLSGVFLGLANPALGCLADRYYISKFSTFGIFINSGLTLRSGDIDAAAKAWPVGLFGLVSILLLTPYFSTLILQFQLQPQEFVTGLALFSCMPTTLSTGVALTQLAGANSALALAMTVVSNILGILIVPFSISKYIASGVGVSVPITRLLQSMVLMLLVPLILGKVLRETFKGVRDCVDQNRKLFSRMNAVFLSLVPWIQISRSRPLLLTVELHTFLAAIGMGTLLHISLLALNILAIRCISAVSGGRESLFAKKENATALILVASQKTLPVMVAVVEQLRGAFGESGLLVLPCIATHLIQIILDSCLVEFFRKDLASKNLKASSWSLHHGLLKKTVPYLLVHPRGLLQFPGMSCKGIIVVVLIVLLAWGYQVTRPPPSNTCGSPDGPPITAPRIELRDGRHLAYKEHGVPKEFAKHKIIFVHQFYSCRHDVAVAANLSPELVKELGLYLVSFDRPGYGESDPHPGRTVESIALDIEELADQLSLGSKFYVIGYSMGGQLVWGCLKYIPHRLAGAALLSPVINYWWPSFPANLSIKAYYRQPVPDQWALRVAHYFPWLTHWWNTQKLFPSSSVASGKPDILSRQDMELVTKIFASGMAHKPQVRQQGEYESIHRDMIVGFGDWEFDPMEIENPFPKGGGTVHLWQGNDDNIVPVMLQRYIAKRLPWIKYHELEGAGHLFPLADGMSDTIIKALLSE